MLSPQRSSSPLGGHRGYGQVDRSLSGYARCSLSEVWIQPPVRRVVRLPRVWPAAETRDHSRPRVCCTLVCVVGGGEPCRRRRASSLGCRGVSRLAIPSRRITNCGLVLVCTQFRGTRVTSCPSRRAAGSALANASQARCPVGACRTCRLRLRRGVPVACAVGGDHVINRSSCRAARRAADAGSGLQCCCRRGPALPARS